MRVRELDAVTQYGRSARACARVHLLLERAILKPAAANL